MHNKQCYNDTYTHHITKKNTIYIFIQIYIEHRKPLQALDFGILAKPQQDAPRSSKPRDASSDTASTGRPPAKAAISSPMSQKETTTGRFCTKPWRRVSKLRTPCYLFESLRDENRLHPGLRILRSMINRAWTVATARAGTSMLIHFCSTSSFSSRPWLCVWSALANATLAVCPNLMPSFCQSLAYLGMFSDRGFFKFCQSL